MDAEAEMAAAASILPGQIKLAVRPKHLMTAPATSPPANTGTTSHIKVHDPSRAVFSSRVEKEAKPTPSSAAEKAAFTLLQLLAGNESKGARSEEKWKNEAENDEDQARILRNQALMREARDRVRMMVRQERHTTSGGRVQGRLYDGAREQERQVASGPGRPNKAVSATRRENAADRGMAADEVLRVVNGTMEGFDLADITLVLTRSEAEEVAHLITDHNVVRKLGRGGKRTVNFVTELVSYPVEAGAEILRYKVGDEMTEDFWNRAAAGFAAKLRPGMGNILDGSTIFKIVGRYSAGRSHYLHRMDHQQAATGLPTKTDAMVTDRENENGGGAFHNMGMGRVEQVEQLQPSHQKQRLMAAVDRWLHFLDLKRGAALDPSALS